MKYSCKDSNKIVKKINDILNICHLNFELRCPSIEDIPNIIKFIKRNEKDCFEIDVNENVFQKILMVEDTGNLVSIINFSMTPDYMGFEFSCTDFVSRNKGFSTLIRLALIMIAKANHIPLVVSMAMKSSSKNVLKNLGFEFVYPDDEDMLVYQEFENTEPISYNMKLDTTNRSIMENIKKSLKRFLKKNSCEIEDFNL